MTDLFRSRENKYNRIYNRTRILTQTNSKMWNRNYLVWGTSNMEPDPGKIKGICYIKQI